MSGNPTPLRNKDWRNKSMDCKDGVDSIKTLHKTRGRKLGWGCSNVQLCPLGKRHTGWNCFKTVQKGVRVCIITQLPEITAAYLKKQHQRVSLCSKFRSLIDFNSHARVNYRLRLTDVEAKTDKWCKVLQVKEGRRFYDVVSEWSVPHAFFDD